MTTLAIFSGAIVWLVLGGVGLGLSDKIEHKDAGIALLAAVLCGPLLFGIEVGNRLDRRFAHPQRGKE